MQQDVKEQLRQQGALRLAQSSSPQDGSIAEQDEDMIPVEDDDAQPTDLSYFGKAFKVLSWPPRPVVCSPCIRLEPDTDPFQWQELSVGSRDTVEVFLRDVWGGVHQTSGSHACYDALLREMSMHARAVLCQVLASVRCKLHYTLMPR